MPNQAFEEKPTDAARALVEHLRRNPDESRGDPAALAARFGLEAEFVRRALARLPLPAERAETARGPSRLVQRAGGMMAGLASLQERAAERPIPFEVATFLVVALLWAAMRLLIHDDIAGVSSPVRIVATLFVFLLAIAAQMAAFYRRRMVRFAAYGGLVLWLMAALPLMVAVWWKGRSGPEVELGLRVLTAGLAMGLLGSFYAALAALASLAGGWTHLRREEREWERLSRQELLERYFEMGRRLDRSVPAPDEPQRWEVLPLVAWVRARPFLTAGLVGGGLGLFEALLRASFGIPTDLLNTLGLLLAVKSVGAIALFLITAFLAGRASRGALCGVAYALATALTTVLPPFDSGIGDLPVAMRIAGVGFSVALYAALGSLGGLGATIQRRAAHEARMQRDDGATLVAEMLEIQWRLEEDATSVTVLVVDAAKSTAMKVGADPLDVEYSFREYQTWIGAVCRGFGGRIHSVAGDGAVVAFADAAAAMGAARRLQTDVGRFNATLNRLPRPFRLRLGLHAGRVAGDLNDVQFTEVIDIAAHVEEIAPVGGIAATAAVVLTLGEEGFLPLAREVDGQGVSIALVPTEG